MKLQYLHWDNFRFLTGLDKPFAKAVDEALALLDKRLDGELSKLIRALASASGVQVNLPPFSYMVQYDEDHREYSHHLEIFDTEKYAGALEKGSERYGQGMAWALGVVVKRSKRRVIIELPVASVLRSVRDISDLYQVYSHSYVHDELGGNIGDGASYIGVTKRGWRTRWAEHARSAERGSRYRFHQAIRHWSDKALTVHHRVISCGQTEAEAMAMEEKMVGLETLYPKGLNMIPGGYAGLQYLRQIGAAGAGERVSPDEKQDVINRFFETASRRSQPNPLAAANWCDPSYAEKVICAGEDRLKPEQIRQARFLASLGRSKTDVATEVGAKNVAQVRRLLAGNTYSRIN